MERIGDFGEFCFAAKERLARRQLGEARWRATGESVVRNRAVYVLVAANCITVKIEVFACFCIDAAGLVGHGLFPSLFGKSHSREGGNQGHGFLDSRLRGSDSFSSLCVLRALCG